MRMLPDTNWNYPTAVWFGHGRTAQIAAACAEQGITRPLVVTDDALVKLPIMTTLTAALEQANVPYHLFSDVQPNPTGENVAAGVTAFRDGGCDGVIAFGGGSALDAGKTIAFMAGQTQPLWDFEDVGDNWTRADAEAIAPTVAIPTTAGTGSEVGRAAVITHTGDHAKKIIFHPGMMPGLVILDPDLTYGLPPHITAWTGIDALVHAVEAYLAPGYHPMADGIAMEAIGLIREHLPVAYRDPRNAEARAQMLVAAMMGATAFQKGLGSVHSLAHTLGGLYNMPHGLANAIILPYALKHNSPVIGERMTKLCAFLEIAEPSTESFIRWILELRETLGIPHSLAEAEIPDGRIEQIGATAYADPSTGSNAMPMSAKDFEKLFTDAYNGIV